MKSKKKIIRNGRDRLVGPLAAKSRRVFTRALLALLCLGIATAGMFNSRTSSAQQIINDPPANGHGIVVFPERDFVSAEGYDPALGAVTFSVIRNGAVVSTAVATPGDDGVAEVNHPGGGCWIDVTPDIVPGDIVRTEQNGVIDQTTTANIMASGPFDMGDGTIMIFGTAADEFGNPLPIEQIEQRLVNPDRFDNGRRTLRASGDGAQEGILAYDFEGSTNWTATYTGLSATDVERANAAQSRIMWLGRDPLAEAELTIYEAGEPGGPTAPCTAPSENPDKQHPPLETVPAPPAYSVLNDPPPALVRQIVSFPSRDFISATGYGPDNVIVSVIRDEVAVGYAVVTPQDDVSTPGFDGIVEVNHPGGGVWIGQTPDIQPGDIVRVTSAPTVDPVTGEEIAGVADQTTTANVIAERPIQLDASTVVIHGSAQDAEGNPLPIASIEQRMISSSADRFLLSGHRSLRAGRGEIQDGTMAYNAPGSIEWTATYSNLAAEDVERILRSESRVLWVGRVDADENELTIFEIGDDTVNGPSDITNATAEPTLSVSASVKTGLYREALSVTLTASDPVARIFYTTDGSVPSTLSAEYTGPISITSTTTLKFMATDMDLRSQVFRETYIVDITAPDAPSAPDLTDASDNGDDANDNITTVATATFTGTAEAGSTVRILDGGTVVGAGSAVGGVFEVTVSALSVGEHTLTAVAVDGSGNVSDESASLTITVLVDTEAPAAPSNLIASTTSSGSGNGEGLATLTWNDNSFNEVSFEIERSLSATGGFVRIATVGSGVTTFAETNGVSDVTNFYRVRAVNANGASDYSAVVGVAIK